MTKFLCGGPVVDSPDGPGVHVGVVDSHDGVVHGELDIVEAGNLSQEGHEPVLVDLDSSNSGTSDTFFIINSLIANFLAEGGTANRLIG